MSRISPATRISLGLALLTVSILMVADVIDLVPDRSEAVLDARRKVCESLAVQFSRAAQKNDIATIQDALSVVVARNPDILSAALRSADGTVLARAGDHDRHWSQPESDRSTPTHAQVPIFKDQARWGTVEVRFEALGPGGILGIVTSPLVRLIAFTTLAGFLVYLLFLKTVLRHLDPSSVIPSRVKSAMDALAEGVVLMDTHERIVLANAAFAKQVGADASSLLGRRISQWRWSAPEFDTPSPGPPWAQAMATGRAQTGARLSLVRGSNRARTFIVNGAPILDRDGRARGALATFDDVTQLEETNAQLQQMLTKLEKSQEEVRRQNRDLQILASRDPLTRCLNRRSFFEKLEAGFAAARRYGHVLSCIMVDIDHFKAINDSHGHAAGDRALQQAADVLQSMLRTSDAICRYGGDEFCILLPHSDLEMAVSAAERLRRGVESQDYAGLHVTATFGVSSTELDAGSSQELLDQTDTALYQAKHNGRNCVARWDQSRVRADLVASSDRPQPGAERGRLDTNIPLHVVNAMMFALARRDIATAEHCRQAADLCVAMARDLMSPSDCFVLEVAAQLHDIGKLTVPDEILLKQGPLTEPEWKIMHNHDRQGVEIVAAIMSCPSLTDIIRSHHAWYSGHPTDPELPEGEEIPLGARILAIADAFSAMTSHRPYRRARSAEDAFEELRRCAGVQFDPGLVKRFIEAVESRDESRNADARGVSDAGKLEIGLEVERLSAALKASDLSMLSVTAGRLAAMAAKQGLHMLAGMAADVEKSAAEGDDLVKIMQLTTRLMNLCASSGDVYVRKAADPRADIQHAAAAGAPD